MYCLNLLLKFKPLLISQNKDSWMDEMDGKMLGWMEYNHYLCSNIKK